MKIEIEIPDDFVPKIQPLYQKYLRLRTRKPREFLEWDEVNEALGVYYTATRAYNPELSMLSILEDAIEREFAKGLRCSVCGMTAEQSAAIGYDCAREC